MRPLAQARADLEKHLAGFKAFVAELESTEGRLARAEEGEILDGSGAALSEEEQLERLSRTLALPEGALTQRAWQFEWARERIGEVGECGPRGSALSMARSGRLTGQAGREAPGYA